DPLALSSVSAKSAQGAMVAIVGGKVVYDPRAVASLNALAAGQRVTDSFTYTIIDAHGVTSSATVSILVQSPLDVAPTARPSPTTSAPDGSQAGQSVLAGATDPAALPGDPPLQSVAGTFTSKLGAHITIAADGTFTYDASNAPAVLALAAGQTGTD